MATDANLTPEQHQTLSEMVYLESGVVLSEKKRTLLMARLAKRMRATQTESVSDYIDLICRDPNERINFIDATTTNHTYFFRENTHCEYLLRNWDSTRPLKIWSAASSSGEEAFSLAIQLLDHSFSFDIYASDVSDSMLNLGRQAIYHKDRLTHVPLRLVRTYFQKGKNQWKDHVRVKKEVRQYVRFEKFNLLSDIANSRFDVIFCRNVMIYFDMQTRQKVVESLCRSLNPGGFVFVGLAESLNGLKHNLSLIVPSGYAKNR